MTDVELSHLLSKFEQGAAKLNAASDSINSVISDIEQKLVQANAGLECWLEYDPIDRSRVSSCEVRDVLLGFTKLNQTEGWRLALRERQGDERQDETGQGYTVFTDLKVTPLWKAPRNDRIKALEKMPRLVKSLENAVETALMAIERAKKMAS